MSVMRPKDFIKTVFIYETEQLVDKYPYISFMVVGIGIEFLGKCIDMQEQDWNKPKNSKKHFKLAIQSLSALTRYKPYLNQYKLYNSFRCGLVHAAAPNFCVTLSSKDEAANLRITDNRLNLRIEDLYDDFKNACNEVINMYFPPNDKMNLPYLQVPGQDNVIMAQISGSTISGTETRF